MVGGFEEGQSLLSSSSSSPTHTLNRLALKCKEPHLADLTMLWAGLLVSVLLAVAVLWWFQGGLRWRKQPWELPGPSPWPLVGNLHHLLHADLPVHFLQLAQHYGPIYRLRCGKKVVVVLNSSELIREALMRKWSDFAGRPHNFLAHLISKGGKDLSLGNYTPTWRLQRKLAHVAFQRCLRGDMEKIVQDQAQHLSKVFHSYNGQPVDVAHAFSLHACAVISNLIFGAVDISTIEEMHNCMIELVENWSSASVQILDFLPIFRVVPNPTLQHLLSCVKNRDALIQSQMKKHQESRSPSEIQDMLDDMLQLLCDYGTEKWGETGLLLDHVHMAIVDLLIGGTETTATLLTWAIAFLVHRPEIQEHIHQELTTVIGFHRDPTYSDQEQLPYLRATILETLRLRPSAPLALPHMTIRNTSLSGFSIPKGTTVIPNLYGAHHDATKWHRPVEFRPERFLEGEASIEARRNLVPFSCGARVCLGEALARMESFLFLAYILRDFQLLPASAGCLPDLRGSFRFLIHCKPFLVRLVPRPRIPKPEK
ncbi:steroid 21-hydroxylase [Pituophis catenifer annectens]|uniref:steroid 21-hydroxylase n=1 Tax=Pituophis catenifer annectens TaxID=94852 RepID=UPI00399194BB